MVGYLGQDAARGSCTLFAKLLQKIVVVRGQQGTNGKEAREETEGKPGRVHRGR